MVKKLLDWYYNAIKTKGRKITTREFKDIWADVCDAIDGLNRVQKRNLDKLLKAATKKEN